MFALEKAWNFSPIETIETSKVDGEAPCSSAVRTVSLNIIFLKHVRSLVVSFA